MVALKPSSKSNNSKWMLPYFTTIWFLHPYVSLVSLGCIHQNAPKNNPRCLLSVVSWVFQRGEQNRSSVFTVILWLLNHSKFTVHYNVQVGVFMTGKGAHLLCSPKSQVSMVTETQSRACVHQWWGLSAHWSNIYVKWLEELCYLSL